MDRNNSESILDSQLCLNCKVGLHWEAGVLWFYLLLSCKMLSFESRNNLQDNLNHDKPMSAAYNIININVRQTESNTQSLPL